ncbi:hypothetical protein B9Z55_008636 [Caenorhabditis nigoni]|uniref:Uncharacterized protein n=1 Tax=Caenorhabditis nigoni TaxID=1611254 RepID=A0A2G5UNF6_9PELO|nr:hypothetical protein B9Z55_008636 [Caenorhabditis nigoni]
MPKIDDISDRKCLVTPTANGNDNDAFVDDLIVDDSRVGGDSTTTSSEDAGIRRRSLQTTHCHFWDDNEENGRMVAVRESRDSTDSGASVTSSADESVSFI